MRMASTLPAAGPTVLARVVAAARRGRFEFALPARKERGGSGRSMRHVLFLGTTLGLGVLAGFTASAHHNPGFYFDMATDIEHKDVVAVSFTVANPHGRLVYLMKDAQGNEREWVAELPAVNMMRRFGVDADLIKPGDVISLRGNPGRNGATMLRVTHALLPSGRVATFYAPQSTGEAPTAFGN